MFTFIETKLFSRLADELLSDAALSALQQSLMENPAAGDIVPAPAACASFASVCLAAASAVVYG
jgi:hypothetical protein